MSSFKLLKTVYELINIIVNEPLILFLKDNQHTLFTAIEETKDNIFKKVVEKFFKGTLDNKTII